MMKRVGVTAVWSEKVGGENESYVGRGRGMKKKEADRIRPSIRKKTM